LALPDIISQPFAFVGESIIGFASACTFAFANLVQPVLKFSFAPASDEVAFVIMTSA
jgi:hypothetical protein